MRGLFIRLSLYRNVQLSVQAMLCPYLRQKPRIFQESWVPPIAMARTCLHEAVASIFALLGADVFRRLLAGGTYS